MTKDEMASLERALWMGYRPTDIGSVFRAEQRRLTDMGGNVWALVYRDRREGCFKLSPLGRAAELPGLELDAESHDDAVSAMRAGKRMVLEAARREGAVCVP